MSAFQDELDEIELREEEKAEAMSALGYDGYDVHLSRDAELVQSPTSTSTTSKILACTFYVGLNVLVLWAIARGLPQRPKKLRRLIIYVGTAILAYVMVQWSNPGYVHPEGCDAPPQDDEYAKRRDAAEAAVTAIVAARERQDYGVFAQAMPWPEWPPMRTAYCHVAKRWIYTYDHYCPILSSAIGERNRFRFWIFLGVQTMALVVAAITAADAVSWSKVINGQAGYQTAFLLAVVLWLLCLGVAAFFLFHTFLNLVNITTHEFLRADTIDYLYNTEDFDLPFSRGLLPNLLTVIAQDGAIKCLACRLWRPIPWVRPAFIDRHNPDILSHPWQNKYYSCC